MLLFKDIKGGIFFLRIFKDFKGAWAPCFCIDVSRKSSCKKASLIDIGTKAKLLFSGNLIPAENEEQFRKNCLKCFKVSVEYLLSHLPHNNKLIQYAQYLHPQKRNLKGSTNGISNAALYITQVCYF